MIREITYINRNNTNIVRLWADGAAVDLSTVTKMELIIDSGESSQTISSVDSADLFDWSAGDGLLIMKLRGSISVEDKWSATLVVYDPANMQGIIWGKPFRLESKDI